MSYFIDPNVAKTYWKGDIIETGSDISDAPPAYSFIIEAISGTRVSASKKYEKKETTVPFNPEESKEKYKNNCDEYLELAKQFAEKHSGAKAAKAEFKDISATIDGSSIEYGKSSSKSTNSRAYEIFVQVIVTDEQGQKTEVTISTDSKTLQSINTIDPNRKNNEKYLG
jgi:phosphopantetheinyl transferase (holo-ACP synthase)